MLTASPSHTYTGQKLHTLEPAVGEAIFTQSDHGEWGQGEWGQGEWGQGVSKGE